jgi:Tfp pilus assembly protein PilF
MNLGKWDLAQEQFIQAINDPKTEEREKALSHLRLGQIYENKGQRSKAISEYQAVLSLQEFDDSHDQAKRSLKKL